MNIQRGQRGKLEGQFNITTPIEIAMQTSGNAVYDYCCFGVDTADHLTDDRYMVFYNQPKSPQNEIAYRMDNNRAVFAVSLSRLPESIHKLVFTISIDGNGTMGQISLIKVSIAQSGGESIVLELAGAEFSQEKAIITFEIYRKNGWRYFAIARGFNGGLSDLLRSYGGEEVQESSETETNTPPSIQQPAPVVNDVAPQSPPPAQTVSQPNSPPIQVIVHQHTSSPQPPQQSAPTSTSQPATQEPKQLKMVSLKCPECCAALEIREGIDTFHCTYCGCKIMLDGMSAEAYHAHVQVKAMEHQENVIDKQNEQERFRLNHESNEKHRQFKRESLLLIGAVVVLLLLGVSAFDIPKIEHKKRVKELQNIEVRIEEAMREEEYDNALILANQLYCDDNWSSSEKEAWDLKRENYIALILDKKRETESDKIEYIAVPESSENLTGKKRSKVEEMFKSAGFTNVTARVTTEKAGLLNWNDTVEHVAISGKKNFDKSETFDKNSAVIIYYYSK